MPAFYAADGTELAYHVQGEGVPLVCLPGGPMRASAYLGDLGGLPGHRQLIMLDLRGTGKSAIPADPGSYRCDHLVEDVCALQDHLGLDSSDVLGHSAGANIAVQYAARHQRRVNKLALITPSGRAVGLEPDSETRREVVKLRHDEPWFAETAPPSNGSPPVRELRTTGRPWPRSSTAAGTPPPKLTGLRKRHRLTRTRLMPSPPREHLTRRLPAPRSPRSARQCWYSLEASICTRELAMVPSLDPTPPLT